MLHLLKLDIPPFVPCDFSKLRLKTHDRHFSILSFLSLSLTLFITIGCQPQTTSSAPLNSTPKTTIHNPDASDHMPPPSQAYQPPPLSSQDREKVDSALEQPCEVDTHCPLYLRCLNHRCSIPQAISGQVSTKTPRITLRSNGSSKASFFVEIARSIDEMSRGLMFRRSMKPNWGMLFIYPDDDFRSFWMKNTYIPLDMLFIGSSGNVVGIIENATPLSTSPRRVQAPAKYVLELNAGSAQKYHLKVGDEMFIENLHDDM